jgi:hypothetical protein
MKTYIYILQEPDTLLVRYVGKSNNPKRRLQHHLSNKDKNNSHSNNWIKSLKLKGLIPIMTVIDETDKDWRLLEMYWIEQFKAWGFNLTNCTNGGEGAYGAGQWNNKPVSAYTKEGRFIKSFESQKQCAEHFKTSQGNVKMCINGKNILLLKKYQIRLGKDITDILPAPSYKKYEWKNKPEVHWMSKPVKCNEDNIEFNSITEAAEYYGILKTSINNILNGKAKQTRSKKSFSYI